MSGRPLVRTNRAARHAVVRGRSRVRASGSPALRPREERHRLICRQHDPCQGPAVVVEWLSSFLTAHADLKPALLDEPARRGPVVAMGIGEGVNIALYLLLEHVLAHPELGGHARSRQQIELRVVVAVGTELHTALRQRTGSPPTTWWAGRPAYEADGATPLLWLRTSCRGGRRTATPAEALRGKSASPSSNVISNGRSGRGRRPSSVAAYVRTVSVVKPSSATQLICAAEVPD